MYKTSKVVFSPRVRKSPYFNSTIKYGAQAYSVYNHMYMPISYKGTIQDYKNLLNSVQLWDVGVERQIQIKGPDAEALSQFLTPRNIKKCAIGQAMYTPLLDFEGGFLNDPVMLRLDDNHYWFSVSDGDSLLWAQGIAAGYKFDVEIDEPDVSPLQVQGPDSAKLMSKVFGNWVNDLGFYRFKQVTHQGIPMVIARMGYSRELCYELFLQDGSKGNELWELLWEAGQEFKISAGGPNIILRLEGGILSYLADIDRSNNPYEVGLDWLVDFSKDNFNGRRALIKEKEKGSNWRLVKLDIEGNKTAASSYIYANEKNNKSEIGFITSAAWSPICKQNIALGTVRTPHGNPGESLWVEIYYQREMHWNRVMAKADIVDKPFWFPARRGKTPPDPF